MQIRFGPEHDARHIDPEEPGGYEWWYFDATSDDGNRALVAIYFLGTPMSPYYRAVVDGKAPRPSDWCGVFFSLHEKVGNRWDERAYTYNIYRDGEYSDSECRVDIGGSSLRSGVSAVGKRWNLSLGEKALWRGSVAAELSFEAVMSLQTTDFPSRHDASPDAHTWVCVAPQCRVEGTITTANGTAIRFSGDGYHDHNFGKLPYDDVAVWYWGRALVRASDGASCLAIYYDVEHLDKSHQALCLLFDSKGNLLTDERTHRLLIDPVRNAYGLEYRSKLKLGVRGVADSGKRLYRMRAEMRHDSGLFSEGPFYRRMPVTIGIREIPDRASGAADWMASGDGIGEIFRPARLCGPIASRAMWSRMRRR